MSNFLMPIIKGVSPAVAGDARYTAPDAAEFSKQGACMTALPPDEAYHLPEIEDQPPPVRQSNAIEYKAAESKITLPNSDVVASRAGSDCDSVALGVKLILLN
jgi:hypothetical protein